MTPVELIIVEKDQIDWSALREQKAAIFGMALHLGVKLKESPGNDTEQAHFERLQGLLKFLDYIQERAALTFGERTVYGEPDSE